MCEALHSVLESRLLNGITEHIFPGAVLGVVAWSGERLVIPIGKHTYDPVASSVSENTLYDCASITKAIPTASLLLQLVEEGRVRLDDRLIDYVPEFKNNFREELRIRHLLSYGIVYPNDGNSFAQFAARGAEALFERLMMLDFASPPGTQFAYTNTPAFFMGLVVERVFGGPLDHVSDEHFFKPLGMSDTGFHPEQFPLERIAPSEEGVQAVVHDESARAFRQQAGKVTGIAGLFSTANDLLTFLEMLLHEGEWGGTRFFKREIVRMMYQNQAVRAGEWVGLGWELFTPRFMGSHARTTTFGKTGFTGTVVVIDPERGVAWTLLSNRTYPKRARTDGMNAVRRDVADLILSSCT